MIKLRCAVVIAILACVFLCAPASADSILYNNGYNGNAGSWTISGDYASANSFTLSSSSTLDLAYVWLWTGVGDTPLTLDWGISDTYDYGNGLGGASDVTLKAVESPTVNNDGDSVWEESFSLSGLELPAGTYWLTLQNAVSSKSDVYWDISNGPSSCYWAGPCTNYDVGFGDVGGVTNSNSFEILGESSATPESASLTLLGAGLLALAGVARRVRRY